MAAHHGFDNSYNVAYKMMDKTCHDEPGGQPPPSGGIAKKGGMEGLQTTFESSSGSADAKIVRVL
jgi:hypothetical protein